MFVCFVACCSLSEAAAASSVAPTSTLASFAPPASAKNAIKTIQTELHHTMHAPQIIVPHKLCIFCNCACGVFGCSVVCAVHLVCYAIAVWSTVLTGGTVCFNQEGGYGCGRGRAMVLSALWSVMAQPSSICNESNTRTPPSTETVVFDVIDQKTWIIIGKQ